VQHHINAAATNLTTAYLKTSTVLRHHDPPQAQANIYTVGDIAQNFGQKLFPPSPRLTETFQGIDMFFNNSANIFKLI